MKLMASSVAPPTRTSLPSPPQHARTGKLYVSDAPIAGFVREYMVNDFCSRYQPNPLNLFLASLEHVLANLKSQGDLQNGYEQIKTALIFMAQALENSTKSHVILSSDRLTFQLGNESFSLPLTSESIIDVLAWPNEIVERLPELSASNQSQLRQAPAWK